MGFRIPSGDELSPQQLGIINLPTNKNYVIQGGPGTGKTVMSVYRAEQIAHNHKVLVLMFNRPLMLFVAAAAKGDGFRKCQVSTWHQWLSDFYLDNFKTRKYPSYDTYDPIWSAVKIDCSKLGKKYKHVVIDEAQDLPIELIELLKCLSENITCFIDPNQAVEQGKTITSLFLKALFSEVPYPLTTNYRNTEQIYDAAKLFRTSNDKYEADTIAVGTKPTMTWCSDYDDQTVKMCRIITQNKQREIGVIVNYRNVNRVREELEEKLGSEYEVQYYKSNRDNNLDFTRKECVRIVTYGTMKGLEFDIVLLPRIEKVKSEYDEEVDSNRIYVAMTRATEQLHVFYFGKTIADKWIDTFGPINERPNLFEWRR